MPYGGSLEGSIDPGRLSTTSFGRPVLPPEAGAFHDGDTASGRNRPFGAAARTWFVSAQHAAPGVVVRLDTHDERRIGKLDDGAPFVHRESM
jgi:hypothetical protein